MRLNNGLAGTLGTSRFIWLGRRGNDLLPDRSCGETGSTLFAQHLPYDEHGLFERFANLTYQALA